MWSITLKVCITSYRAEIVSGICLTNPFANKFGIFWTGPRKEPLFPTGYLCILHAVGQKILDANLTGKLFGGKCLYLIYSILLCICI